MRVAHIVAMVKVICTVDLGAVVGGDRAPGSERSVPVGKPPVGKPAAIAGMHPVRRDGNRFYGANYPGTGTATYGYDDDSGHLWTNLPPYMPRGVWEE